MSETILTERSAQESAQKRLAGIIARRDKNVARSSELANDIAKVDAIRLQTVVLELMRRSNDRPEVANAIVELLNSLETCAVFGNPDEPLTPGRVDLTLSKIKNAAQALMAT